MNLNSNVEDTNVSSDIDTSQKVTTPVNGFYEYIESKYTSIHTNEQLDILPLKGYEWTVENPEFVRFNIGGVIYLPEDGIGKGKVNVFFDGKEYIWRSQSGNGTFSARMNFENSPFLQSSFFPNFIPDKIQKIELIPDVKDNTVSTKDNFVPNNKILNEAGIQENYVGETGTSQSKHDALNKLLLENNE